VKHRRTQRLQWSHSCLHGGLLLATLCISYGTQLASSLSSIRVRRVRSAVSNPSINPLTNISTRQPTLRFTSADDCDRTFGSQQSLDQHFNSPAHVFECNGVIGRVVSKGGCCRGAATDPEHVISWLGYFVGHLVYFKQVRS
jgi:hypothetical protein